MTAVRGKNCQQLLKWRECGSFLERLPNFRWLYFLLVVLDVPGQVLNQRGPVVRVEVAPISQLVAVVRADPAHAPQVLVAHVVDFVDRLVLVEQPPPVSVFVRKPGRRDVLDCQRFRVLGVYLHFVVVFVSLFRLNLHLAEALRFQLFLLQLHLLLVSQISLYQPVLESFLVVLRFVYPHPLFLFFHALQNTVLKLGEIVQER